MHCVPSGNLPIAGLPKPLTQLSTTEASPRRRTRRNRKGRAGEIVALEANARLTRLQCYEGLYESKLLYGGTVASSYATSSATDRRKNILRHNRNRM